MRGVQVIFGRGYFEDSKTLRVETEQGQQFINFEKGRWYRIRVSVTDKKIEAWIDEKKIIEVETAGRKISVRAGDIEMSKPFGIASWETTGALREIKLRRIEGK